ncbi:MAG: riboflavin synthase [Proteobacteria bacterium]|nr:riboflavin synthase [Pseudomonadota bacterium]MCH8188980.1 riboflavin synthase [Pseudomonadota bacterium]
MFTGLITDVGAVRKIEKAGDMRLEIGTQYDTSGIEIGASIACSGPCLTVVDKGPDWFAVNASAETLSKTTLGSWSEGAKVNLERSLRVGEEMGGHIVTGHVDGTAKVVERHSEGDSIRFEFEMPKALERYVASKGAVALDGISLTVNEVEGNRFGINIIPHTQQATCFGDLRPGDEVNLEIDVLARYVARLEEAR